MAASTIAHQEAANLLTESIGIHGWKVASFARVAGVKDSTVRKYMTQPPQTPDGKLVYRMARALGSRDGTRLLYAFGLDKLAQELAAADLPAISPVSAIEEVPHPEALSLDERLTRVEERLEDLHRVLVGSGSDKPGYHAPLTPVTDITEWVRRPIPAPAVGF